jgi:hypothetical protein
MSKELQDKLDKAAKALEPILAEVLNEIELPQTITDSQTPDPICVICSDPATHQKLGRDVCEYHWDLSNDHKRGR